MAQRLKGYRKKMIVLFQMGRQFTELLQQDLDKACIKLGVRCVRRENISDLASKQVGAIISGSNRWHINESYPDMQSALELGNTYLYTECRNRRSRCLQSLG
jgi:hypothetical protein